MFRFTLLPVDLKLFDAGAGAEAGAGAAPAGATPAGDAGQAHSQADQNTNGSSRRSDRTSRSRRGSGDNVKVLYGKQDSSDAGNVQQTSKPGMADVTTASDTKEAKRAEFEKLVNGDYKDEFTERTQQIIDRRFKQTKSLEESLSKVNPILDMLRQKHNLPEDATPEQIMKAIENDDSYWEEAAEKKGLTVDQYKEITKLERENAELKKFYQRQEAEGRANETYNQWMQQAEAMKAEYPEFDLRRECVNPRFTKLLSSGIDVKTAYEVTHINDVKQNVARSAASKAENNVVQNIRTKGARPAENGISQSNGVIVKSDVSKLTKADRAAIYKAAQGGARIRF